MVGRPGVLDPLLPFLDAGHERPAAAARSAASLSRSAGLLPPLDSSARERRGQG
jgi:hypothetical protein